MTQLSDEGQRLAHELAIRHGISTDAVTHMMVAVHNGGGTMAQFSHPEFAGSGQWMMGGMTMVSDLFNHSLKSRVDHLCSDIAGSLAEHQLLMPSGSSQSQSQSGGGHHQTQSNGSVSGQNTLFAPDSNQNWWPPELGQPSASGGQNDARYAYFADRRRLAIQTSGTCWVYDTAEHQIGGFSQQQGGGGGITMSSQFGTVELAKLPVVWRGQGPYTETLSPTEPPTSMNQEEVAVGPSNDNVLISSDEASGAAASPTKVSENLFSLTPVDVMDLLERLAGLKERGLISEDEFAGKKRELLERL